MFGRSSPILQLCFRSPGRQITLLFRSPGVADVRLTTVLVNEARKTHSTYLARHGRSETRSALDLEFVPRVQGSNELTLLWKGQPLPKAAITVYRPAQMEAGVHQR